VAESYVQRRNRELGIPEGMNGQPDFAGDGTGAPSIRIRGPGPEHHRRRRQFGHPEPRFTQGEMGGRIWPKMRLKDRIDAIIAHEYEELLAEGKHVNALKAAATTKLPISDEARRLNRARAR